MPVQCVWAAQHSPPALAAAESAHPPLALLQGPILMTTNCIIEPRPGYSKRIFTTGEVRGADAGAVPAAAWISRQELGQGCRSGCTCQGGPTRPAEPSLPLLAPFLALLFRSGGRG